MDPPTPEIEPAIHVLLREERSEAAKLLIERGANLFLRNARGELPIQVASVPLAREHVRDVMVKQAANARGAAKKAMEADAQIAKELCAQKINELFLDEAEFHPGFRREQRLRDLVAEGADVNAKSRKGMTALHFAARRFDVRLINDLLEMGANPFAKNRKGELPMDLVKVIPDGDTQGYEKKTKEALRVGMAAWEQKELDAAAKPAKPTKPNGEKKPGRDKGL